MPYGSRAPLCPYYRSYGERTIRCEWMKKSFITTRFPTKERHTEHMDKYCCDPDQNWKACPLAAMMNVYYAKKGAPVERRPKRVRKKVRPEGRKEIRGQIRMEGT